MAEFDLLAKAARPLKALANCTGDVRLSTQYWGVASTSGSITCPVTELTMVMELCIDPALRSPILTAYSFAMACIAEEW